MDDRRVRRTKKAIQDVLMKQMLVKKYDELSVSSICEEADISRRTFYLHYKDIDDVFRQMYEEINQPLYEGIRQLEKDETEKADDLSALSEIFRLINQIIENNTGYLTRIAGEPSYFAVQMRHILLMKELIGRYMKQTGMTERIRKIYLDYYISGILELYMQWYRHEHDMTLEEIRQFAINVIRADLQYFEGTNSA